ncbi:MAG: tetraacyldisaccharide [Beijerinckiaceae bacterium]|nr:MAG: tetraacyldisaccharide [Beijerinckiaceae bacterium]
MKMPAFWQRDGSRLAAWLLHPFGIVYGWLTLRRLKQPGWRAPVPVISIGNFTAGGAGKTPTAIAVAQALTARGERPAFITRGYGGRERGPLLVDPSRHSAGDVGDEPLLLARYAPVIVARDRAAGARLATTGGASCLVLDDALQNPALIKDFSLAVIDGGFGFGNGDCVPAGPLRAPVGAMKPYVDAVLIIGDDEIGCESACHGLWPVFSAAMVPDPSIAKALAGQQVVAFCGIGRPEKFRETLEASGVTVSAFHAFGDHHVFTDAEAERLLAAGTGARLVTTEKDHVRLRGTPTLERLAQAAQVVPVMITLEEGLVEALYRALDSARSR